MKKIKYLFGRIVNMDFSNFFNYINKVHERNKKNKILIFFDIVYCGLKYGSGYIDYDLFRMDELNKKQRKTVVTRGVNNSFIKYFNGNADRSLFADKIKFNYAFDDFLNRDWFVVNEKNQKDFKKFINDKEYIMGKPADGTCGKGIQKLKISDYKNDELHAHLLKNNILLAEEVINQDDRMSKMYSGAINTIRVITLKKDGKSTILAAYFRIGNNGRFVDNFNSGGMVVPIDVKSGTINYPALDKNHNLYESHPSTDTIIKGFKIPDWNKILNFANKLAIKEELGMVGWDICLSDKGPTVVEGNDYPGHDIYQLPPHRTNNIGMKPEFIRALNDINVKEKDVL